MVSRGYVLLWFFFFLQIINFGFIVKVGGGGGIFIYVSIHSIRVWLGEMWGLGGYMYMFQSGNEMTLLK